MESVVGNKPLYRTEGEESSTGREGMEEGSSAGTEWAGMEGETEPAGMEEEMESAEGEMESPGMELVLKVFDKCLFRNNLHRLHPLPRHRLHHLQLPLHRLLPLYVKNLECRHTPEEGYR